MNPTSRPSWVADAIFYQIFPDRFAASTQVPKPANLEAWDAPPTRHGYKGGDLYGVIEHLDWLTDLGVSAIYFNPIFQSASNHRYHTHDYFLIDPLLGGDQAFEDLMSACRDRNMKVVLDGVFNHASRGFFRFNDILENGSGSPWLDWFTVKQIPLNAYHEIRPPNYSAWWDDPALPQFNTENPAVREYLMEVAEHWIRRGIDGWRLDVPEEIVTEGFWEE
ncbi:MAG: alpha-amylase family glycosyl hydrolase, partial [Acidimicrobiia bacterium]